VLSTQQGKELADDTPAIIIGSKEVKQRTLMLLVLQKDFL
jgi:hypothetical protein